MNKIEEIEERYKKARKERGIEPVNYSYLTQDVEYIYCIDETYEGEKKVRFKWSKKEIGERDG